MDWYYTRLGDEITAFNQVKKILPISMHKGFARAWTDDSYVPEFEKKVVNLFREERNTMKNIGMIVGRHLMKLANKALLISI